MTKSRRSPINRKTEGAFTRADARKFRARWQLVNDAEQAELRATPMEQKLVQLAALMASADAMGWTGDASIRGSRGPRAMESPAGYLGWLMKSHSRAAPRSVLRALLASKLL